MKKIAIFSLVLLTGGIFTIAGLSSFRETPNDHFSREDITHFKFDELATANEANLENVDYWEVIAEQHQNPCTAGTAAPCIIHVDNSLTGISPSDSDEQKVIKLVDFLISLWSEQGMNATEYVALEDVYDYQRS